MVEFGSLNPEQHQNEQRNEKVYPVELIKPVFAYLAGNLNNAYEKTHLQIQEEGSYRALMEFQNSPFTSLIAKILNVFHDPEGLEEIVKLSLSDNDMKIIKSSLNLTEGEEIDRVVFKYLSREYQSAKFRKRFQNVSSKAKGIFKTSQEK